MNAIFGWIISASTNHDVLVYGLITVLAIVEGPIVSVILGVLLQLNYVYFIPSYVALMAGDLIGDVGWYFIGRRYGQRFIDRYGTRFHISDQKVDKMRGMFHKHQKSVLFISKITNGLGFSLVTLMTAGMMRIPFAGYLTVNVIGQLIWTGVLLAVGYYFSNALVAVNNLFGRISLIAGAIILIFIGYRYWKHLKAKAENMTP